MLFGSGYLQRFHMRWFHGHLDKKRVKIIDHNVSLAGLSVSGPDCRAVVQSVCDIPLANTEFSFLSATLLFQQLVARKVLAAGGQTREMLPELPVEDIHHPHQ